MHATGLFAMGRKIIDYVYRSSDQAGIPNYNTAGVVTFSASDLLQGIVLRDCNGAGRADLTPTAQQIIDSLTVFGRPPVAGHSYRFVLRNSSGGAFATTLTAGTGVTISGTAAVAQLNSKEFMVVINNAGAVPAVTFYSLGSQVF
jgi:hypothetical protein